jgi:DNA-binding MarR family transcriptional regulator
VGVSVPAHIGGIPIEEWLPFLVPVIAIYVYVRRRERRRRAEVQRVLDAGGALSDDLIERILGEWRAQRHDELTAEHVRLMAPPGPNGASAAEIAGRMHRDERAVARLLGDLVELGYVEEEAPAERETKVWLTADGFALAHMVERAVLAAFAERAQDAHAAGAGG